MNKQFDVAIVGAGIVGMAHAWMASLRGHRVVVLERSTAAEGASIRNFGMIWPIGQPAGERYQIALESRRRWLQLDQEGVLTAETCGALHLAHRDDEMQVLEEFCALQTHEAELFSPSKVLESSRLANPAGLRGAMYSPTELRVDPRTASAKIANWLQETTTVEIQFGAAVSKICDRELLLADGERISADRIVVCSGSDLRTLFPEMLSDSDLRLCKLQMLKTEPIDRMQPQEPHVASGLTLRHYESFAGCQTLPALQQRIQNESPELNEYGIHVMASWRSDGQIILGDSHQYDAKISVFDSTEIDALIVRELRKVITLPNWNMNQRWHGIYAKHPTLPVWEREVEPGVHVCTGTGGAGMTMAFGLAEQSWQRWEG